MNRASKLINLTLASLLVAVCAIPTEAQTPNESRMPDATTMQSLPGAARPGSDPLQLLQLEEVQKELKLTDAQIEQLKKISDQAHSQVTQSQRSRGTMKQTALTRGVETTREEVASVLKPNQLERLRQVLLQVNGWSPEPAGTRTRGTNRPDPLRISSEQQKKLVSVNEQGQQQLRSNFTRTRSTNAQEICNTIMSNRERMQPIREEKKEQVLASLSSEQRTTLDKLKGETFELQPPTCPAK